MRIILASQSPRRRELLRLTGLDFDVTPTNVDETQQDGEDPAHYAQRLSREKAQAAASQLEGEALIVAADTVVVYTGEVLGKPETTEEATTVLQRLRRKTHHVITAVTMLHTSGQMVSDTCSSSVIMRDYTDAAIAEYVTSGDPFDKAGAYGIQNDVFHPVEDFAHCFANVMGLPLCHISRMMGELGLDTPLDVPSSCQAGIGYNCPVFEAILRGEM